jgi:hypothetical protein
MLQTFAEALTGAEADVICGAPYGEASEERVTKEFKSSLTLIL